LERIGLERADAELLETLEADFAEARVRAGAWLACRPGCSDCCHGPFPITRLDVWRLHRGLDELTQSDPDRAAAVRQRAAACVAEMREGFSGDPSDGRLSQDESLLDAFFERHAALPCPALDPETRKCDLYRRRPVSCRTYGPPVRFGSETPPPCDLCFRGASTETVETCRVEPDREGSEQAILDHLEVAADGPWETLIAHALHRVPEADDPRSQSEPGAATIGRTRGRSSRDDSEVE
jgi:Fe-S-cluster containining protein